MPTRPTCLCFSLFLLVASMQRPVASADDGRELDVLQSHLVEYLTQDAPSESAVQRYVTTLQPDGSWPDVDYADRQRGGWLTYSHMARVLELARSYRCSGHASEKSTEVREAIVRALNHWLEHDYQNSNWWYGRIGVPRLAAPTLILMTGDLPPQTRANTIQQILDRSQMGMTGQNKVWVAGIALMKGVLTEDLALIQTARDAILSELRITTSEGVQPDFSFHQHGPQQQWGNYGASFGRDMLQWSVIFRDTRFAVSPEQQEILCDYLTGGSAWIVWRGQMDISGCGRQIFPGCQSSKGQGILGQLRDLKTLAPSRTEQIDQILDSRRGDNLLTGHKHYWRSDITVHRRPNWYASVKMSSTRVIGAETCNSENLLGLHLGDGVTYFLLNGREYEDLFPLWDWRRLPGTTCLQDGQSLTPSGKRCRGGSDFVGGVTDGRRGVSVLEYRRDGLQANKSWFFLDDAVVCLGAGVTSDGPEEVLTSIEQSTLNGPVVVSEAGQARRLEKGRWTLDNPEWIHHAGIGYRLLTTAEVQAECVEKQGDWGRVHDRNRGLRTARGNVFSLWVSHGDAPQQADYAYSVHPGTRVEDMPTHVTSSSVDVLSNSATLQAISLDGGQSVLAVFYRPGRLRLPGGYIEVDAPCVLIADVAVSPPRLHVADPTHRQEAVVVRIAGQQNASGELNAPIELPQGARAGATTEHGWAPTDSNDSR